MVMALETSMGRESVCVWGGVYLPGKCFPLITLITVLSGLVDLNKDRVWE